MKTIGLTAHVDKLRCADALVRLVPAAAARGLRLVAWGDTAALLERQGAAFTRGGPADADAVMVLGGDGTMLRAVRDTVLAGRPVIGLNLGSLGFLTSVSENDLERALDCLARDDYTVSTRRLAVCAAIRGGQPVSESLCLNECVIRNGDSGRMVELAVEVDGGTPASISADGLIVATPTGSTGHSLAAGGPILFPACPAFVLTFICAHALSARPLVIPDSSRIEIGVVHSPGVVSLIVDGQSVTPLEPGDRVRVGRSPITASFVHLPGYDFLSLLRQKLHWQGSSARQSRAG